MPRAARATGRSAAATYDPEIDTWTSIDANPQPATGNGRGHEPVVGRGIGMIGADAAFVLDGQYYAFRPDSWDWDWLPAPERPTAGLRGRQPRVYQCKTGPSRCSRPDATAWTTVRRPVPVDGEPAGDRVHRRRCSCSRRTSARSGASTSRLAKRARALASVPRTGPFVGGFTGKSVLFVGTAEVVAFVGAPARGATRRPG